MDTGVGLVPPSSNGMLSKVKPPDEEADHVERDPSNRYVRVFVTT